MFTFSKHQTSKSKFGPEFRKNITHMSESVIALPSVWGVWESNFFFPRYLEDFECLGMSRVSIRGGASGNGFQPGVFFFKFWSPFLKGLLGGNLV